MENDKIVSLYKLIYTAWINDKAYYSEKREYEYQFEKFLRVNNIPVDDISDIMTAVKEEIK